MKLGDIAQIRYKQLIILQYFPKYNCYSAAQPDATGGHYINTKFYFPAGILQVAPTGYYPNIELKDMKYNENVNMFADIWIGDTGYYMHRMASYNQTGTYMLYPLKNCLKHNSIQEAVDFEQTPIIKQAEFIYNEEQEGGQLVGEVIDGSLIKGPVIIISSEKKGLKTKRHKEITTDLLANQYITVYCVIAIQNKYWLKIRANTLKFE